MGRLQIPRMVAAGSLVGAATAVRVGAGWLELWAERTPSLMALAVGGSLGGEAAPARQAAFRDGLLALARESAERSWRELRRAVDDLDERTRPEATRPEPTRPETTRSETTRSDPAGAADPSRAPFRPYRVKP